MFSVIDEYLGVNQAKKIVYNPIDLISIYNKAAEIGNKKGGSYFVFSEKLVEKLSAYYSFNSISSE